MQDYLKWLHAHHDVHNQSHTQDMYSYAGVNPVHKDLRQFKRVLKQDGFVILEIVDPRKYLAAKLRYGI
jgi:hypothetical protein